MTNTTLKIANQNSKAIKRGATGLRARRKRAKTATISNNLFIRTYMVPIGTDIKSTNVPDTDED